MAQRRVIPLSVPTPEYDRQNEAIMRRTLEIELARLGADIDQLRRQRDTEGSLAMRRHQFLLMGAS